MGGRAILPGTVSEAIIKESIEQIINNCLDFEYDDQPDTLNGYNGLIAHLWLIAQDRGQVTEFVSVLQALLMSEDPTVELNSMFVGGSCKHDIHDLSRHVLQRQPSAQSGFPPTYTA